MLQKLFSAIAPTRKKALVVHNRSNIHDSNEDILRIIKLYNQGTIKTVNDEAALNGTKYPYLLKYRASNLFVFFVASLSIFTSIYVSSSLSTITSYIIDNQIKLNQPPQGTVELFPDDAIEYVLSSFYLSGLLSGSLLFGWLGCLIRQRKFLLLVGTAASIMSSAAFVVSIEYWMLFPAKFLQGISNASIWLMCASLIADVWPQNKWGFMVGFIVSLYPLGLTSGLMVGAIFQYASHRVCFFCALGLSCLTLILQICVIERFTIPSDWLETDVSKVNDEDEMQAHDYRDMQRGLDIMEQGAMWSKSSSMSTINLRDQPIIFEKEKDYHGNSSKINFQNLLIVRLVKSAHFISFLYQIVIIAAIMGALKPSLLHKLEYQMIVTNVTYRNIVMSTFLVPYAVSAIVHGWLCNRFGSKIVGLTSSIISVPACIWIGVPNQNIQSVVSALAIVGVTLAGMSVSVLFSTIKVMQTIYRQHQSSGSEDDKTKKEQQQYFQQQQTVVFATLCIVGEFGLFLGFFASKFANGIGFFWLCFIFAMLLATCIAPMALFPRSKVRNHQAFSPTTGKKSIVNNTRPESFAESILSDDETTLGSSSKSVCNVALESKESIIVIP